jgi:hypothetical protein
MRDCEFRAHQGELVALANEDPIALVEATVRELNERLQRLQATLQQVTSWYTPLPDEPTIVEAATIPVELAATEGTLQSIGWGRHQMMHAVSSGTRLLTQLMTHMTTQIGDAMRRGERIDPATVDHFMRTQQAILDAARIVGGMEATVLESVRHANAAIQQYMSVLDVTANTLAAALKNQPVSTKAVARPHGPTRRG